ncbi:MAG: ARMT1-like domain-containing protein [Planctomycetota bacterium]|nr:ARMT1-like domain-containing protein [Planctomycetota bacterium]
MKTFFDCIPCFVRQALDAVRLVTDDELLHEQLLREVLREAGEMDLRQSPPAMGRQIHRLIRDLTGQSDPYRQIKDRFNRLALDLYPELERRLQSSADPMDTAIRLAIAGNIIDFGVNSNLDETHVHEAIEQALTTPFDGDVKEFAAALSDAEDILFLADNAGEIVFDRLLLRQMPLEKVTVVVKGSPVINDATMVDAEATGITDMADVIDNGSDAPGTILNDCSESFRQRFDEADMVIAKGQGNYETLSDAEKDIFFILKAKCPVITEHLGCQVGSMVLRRSRCAKVGVEKGNNYAAI